MKSSRSSFDNLFSLGKENQQHYDQPLQSNEFKIDMKLQQFQTLKQINRILDSNPESIEAKDQKIRSLIVMFQRQLDINKKLQHKLFESTKKIQGLQNQVHFKTTQVKSYEKNIIELKEKIINLERQNKTCLKKLQQSIEQTKLRGQLVQKTRQSYINQKYSMQNELQYLKQKNLDHFKQKLDFSAKNLIQNQNVRKVTHSKTKSDHKTSRNQKSGKKLKKQDIIRRNILALSKKQNELKLGQNLLRKFQQNKVLTSRMKQIQKGHYESVNIIRH